MPIPGVTEFQRITDTQLQETTSKGISGSLLGQFLKGRIRTMVGYRQDSWKEYRIMPGPRDADFKTNFDFANPGWRTAFRPSLSYGSVVSLLPQVQAYANFAESFRMGNAAGLIDGSVPGPRVGSGLDYGLRFDLWNSRITAGISLYDLNFTENIRQIPPAQIQAFRTLMDAVQPREENNDAGKDTSTTSSKGFELEVVANLTDNWPISANYSHTKPVDADSYPRFLEMLKTIEAGRSRVDPTLYNANFPLLDAFRNTISNGEITTGTRQDAFAIVTRYELPWAAVKGLYAVGAMRWKSALLYPGAAYGNIPTYSSFDAKIGYRLKLRSHHITLTLAVQNLTDEIYVSGVRPGFFTYSPPRQATLTMRTQF